MVTLQKNYKKMWRFLPVSKTDEAENKFNFTLHVFCCIMSLYLYTEVK